MSYKTHIWYCTWCNKELLSMGVATHRRGKKHLENIEKKKAKGQSGAIYRVD